MKKSLSILILFLLSEFIFANEIETQEYLYQKKYDYSYITKSVEQISLEKNSNGSFTLETKSYDSLSNIEKYYIIYSSDKTAITELLAQLEMNRSKLSYSNQLESFIKDNKDIIVMAEPIIDAFDNKIYMTYIYGYKWELGKK